MIATHRHTLFEVELSDGRWFRVTATDRGLILLVVVVAAIVCWRVWRRATRNPTSTG